MWPVISQLFCSRLLTCIIIVVAYPFLKSKARQQHLLENQGQNPVPVLSRKLIRGGSAPILTNDVKLLMPQLLHELSHVIRHGCH